MHCSPLLDASIAENTSTPVTASVYLVRTRSVYQLGRDQYISWDAISISAGPKSILRLNVYYVYYASILRLHARENTSTPVTASVYLVHQGTQSVEGYLAHKKPRPLRTLRWAYA